MNITDMKPHGTPIRFSVALCPECKTGQECSYTRPPTNTSTALGCKVCKHRFTLIHNPY